MFDIIVKSNIDKAITLFLSLEVNLQGLAQADFLTAKQREFQAIAKHIVEGVVYVAYKPKVYERTMDLLRSIGVRRENNKLTIQQVGRQTKIKSSNKKKTAGKYTSYGKYVMMGEGFVSFIGPRNFLDAWMQHFSTTAGFHLGAMLRFAIDNAQFYSIQRGIPQIEIYNKMKSKGTV